MAHRQMFAVQIGAFCAHGGLQVYLGPLRVRQSGISGVCWFAGVGAMSWCLAATLQVAARAYPRPPVQAERGFPTADCLQPAVTSASVLLISAAQQQVQLG